MFLRLIAAGVLLVFAGVVLWWFGRAVTVVGETVVLLGDSVAVVGVIVAATGILALVCYNIWRWWQRYTSEEARHERAARQSIDEEIDALKSRRRTLGDWLTLEDYPLRPSEEWLDRFEELADRLGVGPDHARPVARRAAL